MFKKIHQLINQETVHKMQAKSHQTFHHFMNNQFMDYSKECLQKYIDSRIQLVVTP